MDELIQRAGASGVDEMVIGMAHRGRLNVLVNTLGKMPKELFAEFEGKPAQTCPPAMSVPGFPATSRRGHRSTCWRSTSHLKS
jgi:hypothetical protein